MTDVDVELFLVVSLRIVTRIVQSERGQIKFITVRDFSKREKSGISRLTPSINHL